MSDDHHFDRAAEVRPPAAEAFPHVSLHTIAHHGFPDFPRHGEA
jgi:hypothetical protein